MDSWHSRFPRINFPLLTRRSKLFHVYQYCELIPQGNHKTSDLKTKRISSPPWEFFQIFIFLITVISTELQYRQQYADLIRGAISNYGSLMKRLVLPSWNYLDSYTSPGDDAWLGLIVGMRRLLKMFKLLKRLTVLQYQHCSFPTSIKRTNKRTDNVRSCITPNK
jgi:hypothetical protein